MPATASLKPAQPHPLGPRDVIDALTVWGRVILTAAAVILALVGGYRLGQASHHLTILARPEATTGMAWSCDGRLTATARFDDLGVAPVRIAVAGVLVAPELASRLDRGPGPIAADADGRLDVLLSGVPYAGTASRIVVSALPDEVGAEVREISLPVLACGRG